eukprot:7234160-Pyramimonas_sp.AAC.1
MGIVSTAAAFDRGAAVCDPHRLAGAVHAGTGLADHRKLAPPLPPLLAPLLGLSQHLRHQLLCLAGCSAVADGNNTHLQWRILCQKLGCCLRVKALFHLFER